MDSQTYTQLYSDFSRSEMYLDEELWGEYSCTIAYMYALPKIQVSIIWYSTTSIQHLWVTHLLRVVSTY